MAAPWTEIEVRATRLNIDGTPASGTIRVKARPGAITHIPSHTVVFPAYGKEYQLDNTGSVVFTLPATDDPDLNPNSNWTYAFSEFIEGKEVPTYSRELPLSLLITGLDLDVVLGGSEPGNYISLVTREEFDALVARVEVLEG